MAEMREILFRGKRVDNGEWVYGYAYYSNAENKTYAFITTIMQEKGSGYSVQVIPETVAEYTGLDDKNGVKIFEGDIIKDKDILHDGEIQMEGVISEVKFNNGCWIISSADFGWDFLHTNHNTVKVIGNIHDNPELLK